MKLSAALFPWVLSTFVCGPTLVIAQSPASPISLIATPIDEAHLVPLAGNVHPFANARFDRGPAPISMPTGRIQLLLRRSAGQEQALTQYLSDLQNPVSPGYHKWLTPGQYGAQFGVDISDIQTVESWLQSHGFHIDKVPLSRNIIQFSGTIDEVQNAFHTSIHHFLIEGKTRFANVTDPQIPAALEPVIAGIGPLNNLRRDPDVTISTTGSWNPTNHSIQPNLTLFGPGNGPILFVDPADAATIYNTPNGALNPISAGSASYSGSGVTIGIVGVSNLNMPDIQNYRTGFLGESTTSANLPTVIIDGNDPGLVPGAGVEAVLDTEVAGGLAPGAKIYFYASAGSDLSDGLFNSLSRAIDDNAVDILNMSFGECEAALGSSGNQLILEFAEQAAAQGISITVSSGDGGSAGCDNFNTATHAVQGLAVSGFASSPYTVAVGGTDFDSLSSSFSTYANSTSMGAAPYYLTAKGYIPERPWNDSTNVNTNISQNTPYKDSHGNTNIIAGGGGVSSVYPKPGFQTSLTPTDGHRDLPDVSLFSGNGFYSAVWLICADSVVRGTGDPTPASDCANTSGQFSTNSTFSGVGGTSAAAPAFAGMLALVAQRTGGRLGQVTPALYQLAQNHPSIFHDVTSGDNSVPCTTGSLNCGSNGFLTGYNAGTGYDLASGLGSVDASAIVNNWSSVALGATFTTLQINSSTASYTGVHGASLTLNVGVSGSGGTPTGVVAIQDNANLTVGGTASGPQNNGQLAIPLNNGAGSADYNGLPGGAYAVSARYGGDSAHAASTSAPINVAIAPEPSSTALIVNAYDSSTGMPISATNIPYGSFVVADANVTGTAEGLKTQGVATGTMKFINGSTVVGTGTVSGDNLASWPPLNGNITVLSGGTYNLTAQYSGDPSFNASTSPSVPFTIVPASTSISAQSILYSMVVGDSTSIVVDVEATPNGGVPPTGSISITANGKTLTTVTSYISSGFSLGGDATIQASQLSPGPNVITFKYSGDSNYSNSSTALSIDYAGNGGFSISPIAPVAISPNSTVTAAVTLVPSGGFVGDVEFGCDVTSAPTSGITCMASPAYMTGSGPTSAMINIAAAASAGVGTYTATLSGGNGSNRKISANSTFTITVGSTPTSSFAIFSNGNLNVSPGSSVDNSSSVTIIPSAALGGQLNLACAVTTSISNAASPPTCSVPASVTITPKQASIIPISVATSATTSTGDYTLSVTATDAATPAITGSSTADLTVTPSPIFALAGSGPATFVAGATTGNTTIVTATPSNGYSGTVNLTCIVTALTTAPGLLVYPICTVPTSVVVGSNNPMPFTLTLSATGNPANPTTGIYLATVSGYDTTLTSIASETAIVVTVGTPGLALSNSGSITVRPGANTGNSATVTVTPSGGFTGTVNLSCAVTTSISNPNDPPTCSVPTSVIISGTTATTATVTINTTAPTTANLNRPLNKFFLRGGGTLMVALLLFGVPRSGRTRRMIFGVIACLLIANAIGCGGGGSSGGGGGGGNSKPGTTSGSYTITVTGKDAATGKVTAGTLISLTVN